MDRRQRKTRQAVYDAFTALLEKKSYSNITVQGRSTFYAHFETKDELLRALCTEIFEHVFSTELEKERTHDFSQSCGIVEAEITHILYPLQESRRYIRGILSSESGELFMRYFKEYLERLFEGAAARQDTEIPRDYMLNHMVCDFSETVRWWMRNETYSPEEISRFFLATTSVPQGNKR